MPRFRYVPNAVPELPSMPFANATEAWFWFVRCHRLRRDGARLTDGAGDSTRPCDPDDIYRAVAGLVRRGRLGRRHVDVLSRFGLRESPPDPRCGDEEQAARLWAESLDRLTTVLKRKAIIA